MRERGYNWFSSKLLSRTGTAGEGGPSPKGSIGESMLPSEEKSMSYAAGWRARFGQEPDLPADLPDLPWLRQILTRRTHRRYTAQPVSEPLLRLLLGAAFSASSKSDFQQATVIQVKDRLKRDQLAALV